MGVIKMIKDPSVKCELSASLKPLPVSPRQTSAVTKNVSIINSERASGEPSVLKLNMNKLKSSYYNYIHKRCSAERSKLDQKSHQNLQ